VVRGVSRSRADKARPHNFLWRDASSLGKENGNKITVAYNYQNRGEEQTSGTILNQRMALGNTGY